MATAILAPQIGIISQANSYQELRSDLRRDVPDQELSDTWQQIKIDPLFMAAWDIVCRAFGDGQRNSGTRHTTHAKIVAKGALELALKDNCDYGECLQNAVVGLLHDVKEDHPEFSKEVDDLTKIGLWLKSLHAINLLTKKEGEKAFDNASRVLTSRMATRAKLPDSKHNSSSDEQVVSIAFGNIQNSLRRYSICIPAYQAAIEGRFTNTKDGIKGYLKTIGQDLLIPENRDLFEKGFTDPSDILRLIDLRSPFLQRTEITIRLPNFRSLGAKIRLQFSRAVRGIGLPYSDSNDDLPPIDRKKTLVETAAEHPSRHLSS